MTSGSETLSSPQDARVVVIRPGGRISLNLHDLWEHRELLYFFVWRDIKVRYKQTLLGVSWAVIQPVVAMVVFTLIFGRAANLPSEGLPYPLFVFGGLVVWTYFAAALASGSASLVANANLLTKVYFPRLIAPIAALVVPLVDFVIAFGILALLMLWYGAVPGWEAFAVIPLVVLAFVTALGATLWLAAANVRYRDIRQIIPFLTQIWFFATPVVYSLTMIPERWQWLVVLNPLASVATGFRWALLGSADLDLGALAISSAVAVVLLATGFVYFQRVERRFADIV